MTNVLKINGNFLNIKILLNEMFLYSYSGKLNYTIFYNQLFPAILFGLMHSHHVSVNWLYISDSSPAPVPFPSTFSEIENTNVASDLKSNSSWSSSRGRQKSRANTDPVPPLRSAGNVGKASSVTWDKTEVVRLDLFDLN